MRILTVRQPWTWAIVHGGKDIENRTRNIAGSYRGPVAIHAGLTLAADDAPVWDMPEYVQALAKATAQQQWSLDERGSVIGVVDLIDAHEAIDKPVGQGLRAVCCTSPWAQTNAGVHLVLRNPRPLPRPIPAKGRLGLWTPDADLLAAITDQLQEAR